MIRALLVDDEPLARQLLHDLLGPHDDVEIVGEAADGEEAREQIERLRPDLLFLDIRMPEMDGFELLRQLQPASPDGPLPRIIFVTAFDHYAVRAFEVAAVDYLLKPYDEERLALALERARERLGDGSADAHAEERGRLLEALDRLEKQPNFPRRLFLKVGDRNVRQPVSEIRWLEAHGKKVRVHAGRRTLEVRNSLTHFESLLDPAQFVRVSRSAIVHLERVVEVQPWFHGDYVLLLDDGAQVTSTRTFRQRLTRLLS